jgi:RNA polymerase sigma-70 factor (ECF subfamily)
VEEHLDALHGLAAAWTRDPELSRELVQRTFLHAFEKLHQLRDAKAARGWLIAIFRNELAAERRARSRFEVWEREALEDVPGDDPGEAQLQAQDLERLPRVLEGLPDASRKILLLRYQQELSYDQIASLLGLPLGTVMSRLHRAKACLKGLLWPKAREGSA